MKAILEIVERLNAAWSAGKFDQLLGVFDPGVVLVAFSPGGARRVVGRDAVIQSYREFAEQSVLHRRGVRLCFAVMESVSGLRFANPIHGDTAITAVVLEQPSISGYRERAVQMRASYPTSTKRATLIHEL